MADYFYIIKPITGTTAWFSIQITNWASRDSYQKINTSLGVTRTEKVEIVPQTNKRPIFLSECRFFKGTPGLDPLDSYYSTYADCVNFLESSSYWTEVSWATFAADNNASDIAYSDSDSRGTYTTNATYPYAVVFPATEAEFTIDLVTYYTVSTSLSHCTCNITSGTQYASGTQVTATVTPENGYQLNSPPTIAGSSGTWSQSGDSYTCTFTVTADTTISATADLSPVYYTVTYDLNHCTADYNQVSVLAGTVVNIAFTPDAGYQLFDNPPSMVTPDDTTYATTYTPGSYVVSGSVTITGNTTITATAQAAPATVDLIDNTSGFTLSPVVSTLPYNAATTLYLTPLAHYSASTPPTIDGASMTLSGGVYEGTVTPISDVTLAGTATEDHYITVSYDLSGATGSPADTTKYYDGDLIELEAIAEDGLYFQTPPYVVYFTAWATQVRRDMTPSDPTEVYPTSYEWSYDTGEGIIHDVVMHGVTQAIPQIEDFGVFNVYNPSLANLTAIANMRYDFSENETYYFKDVDLGQFVLSLMKVYVPLTTAPNAEIVLGGYRTGESCPTIIYPYVTVDCGSVQLNEFWHSNLDYDNTKLKMFVPFYGFIDLDPVKYMNKTVSLEYQVELITGKALVGISANDVLIDTVTCRVAMDIPYLLTLDKNLIGKYTYNEYLLMDKTPYIQQWTCDHIYTTGNIRGTLDEFGLVSNKTGYFEFDIMLINVAITKEEKDEIITLCKKGVYL